MEKLRIIIEMNSDWKIHILIKVKENCTSLDAKRFLEKYKLFSKFNSDQCCFDIIIRIPEKYKEKISSL